MFMPRGVNCYISASTCDFDATISSESDVAAAIHVAGTEDYRLMTRRSESASDDEAVFERHFFAAA